MKHAFGPRFACNRCLLEQNQMRSWRPVDDYAGPGNHNIPGEHHRPDLSHVRVFARSRPNDCPTYYTFWSEKDGAPSQISALAQTEDGYLWIGSTRGLFRFDGVKLKNSSRSPELNCLHTVFFAHGHPGRRIWIAFDQRIRFIKDGTIAVFRQPGELPDSPVPALPVIWTAESGRC